MDTSVGDDGTTIVITNNEWLDTSVGDDGTTIVITNNE